MDLLFERHRVGAIVPAGTTHEFRYEVLCPGKIGPILTRVLRDARKGQDNGTTEIYAGADHREAT